MTAWIESARGLFTDLRVQATEIIDAGDAVVAGMRFTGRGGLSGVSIDAEVFYALSFRDGQVIAAVTYTTRREALDAVGLAE